MDYSILTPLIPFVIGILLKILLDFNLAFFVVKYFHRIPVRGIFRTKSNKINGEWKQIWDIDRSERYQDITGRQSFMQVKQFGKYIYGEFRSNNDEEYYVFGEVNGRNIVGKWGDKNNDLGYFGAFELRIIDARKVQGIWLGHSNSQPNEINASTWTWLK